MFDYGFNTNRNTSNPTDWLGLDSLFPTGRPRHTAPGRKVWVRHGDNLITSYTIGNITYEHTRVSSLNGRDYGPGWIIWIKDEVRVNVPLSSIPDPESVASPWGSGPRYFRNTPLGGFEFIRVR
jgi:hypothetical protein